MKHKHYDLIQQWIENPNKYIVYCRSSKVNSNWIQLNTISWLDDHEYKLVRKQRFFRVRRYILNERGEDFLFMHTEGHYYEPERMPGFVRWVDDDYYEILNPLCGD